MQEEYLISIDEFCTIHNIEISFVNSLQQTGLIEITIVKESSYINASQVQQLERIIRLYNELDINLEGIEAIYHLLQKITFQQQEIIELRNRLRLYEIDD
jgi:chaperone modulatory protein CbpM